MTYVKSYISYISYYKSSSQALVLLKEKISPRSGLLIAITYELTQMYLQTGPYREFLRFSMTLLVDE